MTWIEEVKMPRKKALYPPELRRQMVALVRAGRTPAELARAFEPSEQCIRNWASRADRDEGRRHDGPTSEECAEVKRLRGELLQHAEERADLAP